MSINTSEIKALLKAAKAKASTDWEKTFVQDQITRFERWGGDLKISPKQIEVLQRIANKESLDDAGDDGWG